MDNIKKLFVIGSILIIFSIIIDGIIIFNTESEIQNLEMKITSYQTNFDLVRENIDRGHLFENTVEVLKNFEPKNFTIINEYEIKAKSYYIEAIKGKYFSIHQQFPSKTEEDKWSKLTIEEIRIINNEMGDKFFNKLNDTIKEKQAIENRKTWLHYIAITLNILGLWLILFSDIMKRNKT